MYEELRSTVEQITNRQFTVIFNYLKPKTVQAHYSMDTSSILQ